MSDLNWCTYCDNAVNPYSDSLYCSEQCLRADALRNHPLLGYDWHEFEDFPRPNHSCTPPPSTASSTIHAHPSATPALTTTSSASSSLRSVSLSITPPTTTTMTSHISTTMKRPYTFIPLASSQRT